jgi:hypothetical protein
MPHSQGEDESQTDAAERASMRFYNGMSSHILAAFGGQVHPKP